MSNQLTDEEINFELARLFGAYDFIRVAWYEMPSLREEPSFERIVGKSIDSGWWRPLTNWSQLLKVASIPFGTTFGLKNKGSMHRDTWSAYPVDARGLHCGVETVYMRSLPHAVALALIAASGIEDDRIVPVGSAE